MAEDWSKAGQAPPVRIEGKWCFWHFLQGHPFLDLQLFKGAGLEKLIILSPDRQDLGDHRSWSSNQKASSPPNAMKFAGVLCWESELMPLAGLRGGGAEVSDTQQSYIAQFDGCTWRIWNLESSPHCSNHQSGRLIYFDFQYFASWGGRKPAALNKPFRHQGVRAVKSCKERRFWIRIFRQTLSLNHGRRWRHARAGPRATQCRCH